MIYKSTTIDRRGQRISQTLIENQQEKHDLLQQISRNAQKKSLLYQKKYQEYDLSKNFTIEFQNLPLLSREEYYQGMKSPDFSLLTTGLSHSYIFTSGGTTGEVKLTAWDHSDQNYLQNWVDECYRSLVAVGLQEQEVVINLFFPGIWATHHLINKALEKAKSRIIPLGGKLSLDLLVEYIVTFQVTTLIGVPSFIVRLTEHIGSLSQELKSKINLKRIFHAGEFLSPNQAEFIQNQLNCHVNPFIYSSTDTGTIGMKCPHCGTNQYHIADSIYLETLDLETGEPVSAGTIGEFIVTSLVNQKAPCIRYRVGDMGIITDSPCPCGNSAPLFTLTGRADDEVKVAGYLISPEIVQKGLELFPELSRNFQIVVEEEAQKAKITINCETVPTVEKELIEDLPEKASKSLIDSYDILEVLIKQGYCFPPTIKLFNPGEIPRNPRTGKIKRVRDLR